MLSLGELFRLMREKIQNEPAKVKVWKMFRNDFLNNILKPLPSPGTFMEVLTPRMNSMISFFANISLNMHFWEKSFKQKLFFVKFPVD